MIGTQSEVERWCQGARRRASRGVRCGLFGSLLVGLWACSDSPYEPPAELVPTEDRLLSHIEVLAHDSMLGRRAGSVNELRSAEYIRSRFIEYGLVPGTPGFFQAFEIPRAVDGRTGLSSQNVLAALPGVGSLADQWVLLGAHYDHLGVRNPVEGDSIYNGADDNASGVAMVLEVARLLSDHFDAATAGASRRSILFQAYGAEEVGLVGSARFCEEPTVPFESVVAMLNFDMVSWLRGDMLYLIGAASSPDWTALVEQANEESLQVFYPAGSPGRSDHYCFLLGGRPVLHFHTGLHEAYHTPTDEVWKASPAGMVRVANLTIRLVLDLVTRRDAPTFSPP